MKKVLFIAGLGLCLAGLVSAGCRKETGGATVTATQPASQPTTTLVAADSTAPAVEPADNSRCFVCHLNYEDDTMASAHARKGVSCEECHGKSDAHCSDENNITAPDVLFATDMIASSCARCHPRLSNTHMTIAADPTQPHGCTECHAFSGHRLEYRTRKWDKKTRQLIESDGVRM